MNDLTSLADGPELTVDIGGKPYQFSELTVSHLAQLQEFIRASIPHPIEALKNHLAGLSSEDRQFLLEKARADARSWPPQIGTAQGAAALLSGEPGQIEALYVGLSIHQPAITRQDARKVFRQLQRQIRKSTDEKIVTRIFACLFGLPDPTLEDDAGPK